MTGTLTRIADERARELARKQIALMQYESNKPVSNLDQLHLQIMVVLLVCALGGCDVDFVSRATGYSQRFVGHIWKRVQGLGLELNPLDWIEDDGRVSVLLGGDAAVIEGTAELTRDIDGEKGIMDVDLA